MVPMKLKISEGASQILWRNQRRECVGSWKQNAQRLEFVFQNGLFREQVDSHRIPVTFVQKGSTNPR